MKTIQINERHRLFIEAKDGNFAFCSLPVPSITQSIAFIVLCLKNADS